MLQLVYHDSWPCTTFCVRSAPHCESVISPASRYHKGHEEARSLWPHTPLITSAISLWEKVLTLDELGDVKHCKNHSAANILCKILKATFYKILGLILVIHKLRVTALLKIVPLVQRNHILNTSPKKVITLDYVFYTSIFITKFTFRSKLNSIYLNPKRYRT